MWKISAITIVYTQVNLPFLYFRPLSTMHFIPLGHLLNMSKTKYAMYNYDMHILCATHIILC